MDAINVQEEMLEEVQVSGRLALFTELRVDKSTIPEGVYCYALRHGDDDSFPVALEKSVRVNYFGSVLMTEEIELEKSQYLSVGFDNFWYTGAEMRLDEFVAKCKKNEALEPFQDGKALAAFLKETFPITEKEGEVLLDCLKEQFFFLGQKDGELYCGEQFLKKGQREIHWEPDAIDDAVNAACEYNYEMILQLTQEVIDTKDMKECERLSAELERFCADEVLLDKLFDRTKYGEEIEELAKVLAEELIRDVESKDGIDGTIEKMKEAASAGKDLLPNVSPELKQNKGRSR